MSTEQIAYLTKGLVGSDPKRVRLYQTSVAFKTWVDTQVQILIALSESMAFAATVIEQATIEEIQRIEREGHPLVLIPMDEMRPVGEALSNIDEPIDRETLEKILDEAAEGVRSKVQRIEVQGD